MQRDGVGSASYEYDANGNRFHEMASSHTTWFGPHGFERTRTPATTDRMELGPVTRSTVTSGPYLVSPNLRDRLGSTIAIGNANGTLAQTRSYDAFGEARNGDLSDRAGGTLGLLNVTLRGFTGHEHVDDARLIHMNGRMYDPVLGRFLSVDPVIQFPTNSQSLNPYSYILNSPLSGKDPSGFQAQYLNEANFGYGLGLACATESDISCHAIDFYSRASETDFTGSAAGLAFNAQLVLAINDVLHTRDFSTIAPTIAVLATKAAIVVASRGKPTNGAETQKVADRSSKAPSDTGSLSETGKKITSADIRRDPAYEKNGASPNRVGQSDAGYSCSPPRWK